MSMFRKVFGNHMAGHNSDSALVPMVPMGGGVAQSATARAEEHKNALRWSLRHGIRNLTRKT